MFVMLAQRWHCVPHYVSQKQLSGKTKPLARTASGKARFNIINKQQTSQPAHQL
jgi:hypothetical protein